MGLQPATKTLNYCYVHIWTSCRCACSPSRSRHNIRQGCWFHSRCIRSRSFRKLSRWNFDGRLYNTLTLPCDRVIILKKLL